MKVSVVVPLAKKDIKYIKRCLLSIQDQDYNNYEVIVVADGHFQHKTLNDKRFRYCDINKVNNAAIVRNFGASLAKGDIFFFLDADCILHPGVISLVIDKFKKNKDIDFIYGAYRFNDHISNVYHSRPYSPYLLESMNYICTMSPMRRQMFRALKGFRKELKFFQDWDFFLRAAQKEYKGYYLKDVLFTTNMPDQDSISGNNAYAFRDKVLKIEKLNNIPSRNICVTSLAAPHQASQRAKILDARYLGAHHNSPMVQSPAFFDLGYETVMMIGFFPAALDNHLSQFPKKCIKILNWIGTDVWQLLNQMSWAQLKWFKNNVLKMFDIQYSNSPELQSELKEIGIESKVLYAPLIEKINRTKLPNTKTVSAYFSEGHPLHNQWFLQDVAKSMPDVKFIFSGTGFEKQKDDNIEYVGWIPIQEMIDKSTVHLRLTSHDGFPHTPIYHLMGGRQVLATFPLKYGEVLPATPSKENWDGLKPVIINKLREMLKSGTKYDVSECRDYYSDLCCPLKYKNIVYDDIEKVRKANTKVYDLANVNLSA